MKRIQTSLLVAPLLTAAVLASPASANKLATAFTFAGTGCVEPAAVAIVPADRVKPFLPPGFTPAEALGLPGHSDVILSISRCEQFFVNGQQVPGGFLEDAGITVNSPDGSPGAHYVELWQTTSIPEMRTQMQRLGVRGGLVPGMGSTASSLGPLQQASVDVPWGELPHSISVSAAAPGNVVGSLNTWWHQTPAGLVRIAYTLTRISDVEGDANITAPAGSDLATLVGSSSATAVGLITSFDFTAVVSAPPLPAPAPQAPSAVSAPAQLGVKAPASGGSAGKASKRRRVALKLTSTQPVAGLRAELLKGNEVLGTGTLAKLDGTASVTIKLKRKLGKASYGLRLSGTVPDGRRAQSITRIKFGR